MTSTKAAKLKVKLSGFEDMAGVVSDVAYFDGYVVGGRLLEGVMFKLQIVEDYVSVDFAEPDNAYEQGLNRKNGTKMLLII